jgi:alcohol dehydrogenase class IV
LGSRPLPWGDWPFAVDVDHKAVSDKEYVASWDESAAAMGVNLRALRDRAPEHPALLRMAEVATVLTGQPDATSEDGIAWLEELTAALSIPGLAAYKLGEEEISGIVTAAQKASSMRGNPIELSDTEVTEIVTRSL